MLFKYYWFIKTVFLRLLIPKIAPISYLGGVIYVYGGWRVTIRNRVRIFPGLRIETHYGGSILIDNNVSIQQNFHITSAKELLKIGKNTTILGNVFVTNIDHNYRELSKHILDQEYLVKKTDIGENCFIGYGASIQAGTILGKQCIVGAGSVVRGEFPDFCVIVGAPAKIIKRYNAETKTWQKTDKNGLFL
ncbi:acyltransferase [Pedobacter sp. N23S346]|uniref:acyltransferase n=1 Tax=Pedobacter sp. N23S346 TaxID=3402750 RepID=UPI003AD50FE3